MVGETIRKDRHMKAILNKYGWFLLLLPSAAAMVIFAYAAVYHNMEAMVWSILFFAMSAFALVAAAR